MDLIDTLAGAAEGGALNALRHQRGKVAAATQASHDALLDPALPGLSLAHRLAVALYACRLTPSPALAAHYRERLLAEGGDAALLDMLERGTPQQVAALADTRLAAALKFTAVLIESPIDGDRALLHTLPAAGLATPDVVTLAQLVAFLSYQTRLLAGLQALRALEPSPSAAPKANTAAKAEGGAPPVGAPPPGILRSHGFTNEVLGWRAWLDGVDVQQATPEQLAVLEESHPKARTSEYYRLLVHQPRILRERSAAYNAIMYAPQGLPRAERELAATVVSRVNGCVYCGSVHAQRFEQLARRTDVIAQVFDQPRGAGTTPREQAIAAFAIALTERPGRIGAGDLQALREADLPDLQILDLVHAIAIFGWANRLMLNLGEPVRPE